MSNAKYLKTLMPLLQRIAAGIARQFGSNCEVIIHDLTKGITNTIAVIENGHVTGRKVGDGASEAVLEALKNKDIGDRYSYFANTKGGKRLKCSTVYIRDDAGEVVALLCINYDISDFEMANRSLNEFLTVEEDSSFVEGIPENVNDLLDLLIEESHRFIGKPIVAMTKEDKKQAIQYLNQKGALLIKKSSERISAYYGISKFTLYNYLNDTEESTETNTNDKD
jgi:predicted transcriptional regulator YheO